MKKAVLALTVLFALTACGGTSSGTSAKLTASEQKVSNGIAAFVSQGSSGLIAKKSAQCFSDKFVAKAGVARLKKAKLLKSDGTVNPSGASFDKPLATTYANAYFSCLDYATLEAKFVAKSDTTVDGTKMAKCIADKTAEADSKNLVISSLVGKPDQTLTAKNNAAITACRASSKKVAK